MGERTTSYSNYPIPLRNDPLRELGGSKGARGSADVRGGEVGGEGVCPYAAYAGLDQMLLGEDGRCDVLPRVVDGGAGVALRYSSLHLPWQGCQPGCYPRPRGHL